MRFCTTNRKNSSTKYSKSAENKPVGISFMCDSDRHGRIIFQASSILSRLCRIALRNMECVVVFDLYITVKGSGVDLIAN